MAQNRIICAAPPERVFDVLAYPAHYAYIVPGTRRIRRFDPDWPTPGSRFHHSLGVGVTVLRDVTTCVEVDPPHRLVVRAHMRPLAVNETVFRLRARRDATLVEVEEVPVAGPAARPRVAAVVDRILWLRNGMLVRRLRTVVERRSIRAGPSG